MHFVKRGPARGRFRENLFSWLESLMPKAGAKGAPYLHHKSGINPWASWEWDDCPHDQGYRPMKTTLAVFKGSYSSLLISNPPVTVPPQDGCGKFKHLSTFDLRHGVGRSRGLTCFVSEPMCSRTWHCLSRSRLLPSVIISPLEQYCRTK